MDEASKSFSSIIDNGPAVLSKDNIDGTIREVTVFELTTDNSEFVVWTASWESSIEVGIEGFVNPIY